MSEEPAETEAAVEPVKWIQGIAAVCVGGPVDGLAVEVDGNMGRPRGEYILALVGGRVVTSNDPEALNVVARRRANGQEGWSVYTLSPESTSAPFELVYRGAFNYAPGLTQ